MFSVQCLAHFVHFAHFVLHGCTGCAVISCMVQLAPKPYPNYINSVYIVALLVGDSLTPTSSVLRATQALSYQRLLNLQTRAESGLVATRKT